MLQHCLKYIDHPKYPSVRVDVSQNAPKGHSVTHPPMRKKNSHVSQNAPKGMVSYIFLKVLCRSDVKDYLENAGILLAKCTITTALPKIYFPCLLCVWTAECHIHVFIKLQFLNSGSWFPL